MLDVLCDGLENLPYEIIRIQSNYFDSTDELFQKRPNLKALLLKYGLKITIFYLILIKFIIMIVEHYLRNTLNYGIN